MSLEVVSSPRAEALVHKRVFPTRVVVVPETKVMGNDAISEKQERTQVFCPLLPKTKAWIPSFHLVCILSYAWVCAFFSSSLVLRVISPMLREGKSVRVQAVIRVSHVL